MVCYTVGRHNDHFKDGDKAIENNNDPGPRKELGQGGCVMGTHFVYAVLDRQHEIT